MSLLPPGGTVLEDGVDCLFCFRAIRECRIHDTNLLQMCLQATVSCSQPECIGLLMSCQRVDWVCRGVVVSSDPSPLASFRAVFWLPGKRRWTGFAVVCFETWLGCLLFRFLESHSGLGSNYHVFNFDFYLFIFFMNQCV